MHYEVEVNGRTRHVTVHRIDGRFVVDVDGRETTVDALRIDAHTWSLLIDTRSEEVTSARPAGSEQLTIGVDGVPIGVLVNGRRRRKQEEGAVGSGPEQVNAPMPGKVVRLLATPGTMVEPRQPLVVIEAMKMENELRASRGGVVDRVLVTEGQSVDAGTLLVVVRPA